MGAVKGLFFREDFGSALLKILISFQIGRQVNGILQNSPDGKTRKGSAIFRLNPQLH